MAWTFYINGREVTPYNVNSLKISEEKESVFRVRVKMSGEIVVTDGDYYYLKQLESTDKYAVHTFTAKKNGKIVYEGLFTIFAVKFNDNQHVATFTTEANDEYTSILKYKDIEVNAIAGCSNKYIEGRVKAYLAFSCYSWVNASGNPSYFPEFPEYEMYYNPNDPRDDGTYQLRDGYFVYASWYSGTPGMPTRNLIIAQERIVVDKSRTMSGWELLDDYGDAKLYGRSSQVYDLPETRNYNSFDDIKRTYYLEDVEGYYDMGIIRTPGRNTETSEWEYNSPDVNPMHFWVKKDVYSGGNYPYRNEYMSYGLKDIIKRILVKNGSGFDKDVKSTLLFGDPAIEGYTLDSHFDQVKNYDRRVIDKRDFKFPKHTSSYSRTITSINNISFSKFIDPICRIYNADWFLDDDGNMRIEHISSVDRKKSVDISWNPLHSSIYSFVNKSIPNRVEFKFSEAWDDNFISKNLKYSQVPCLGGDLETLESINIDSISTDVDGCNSFLASLQDKGFMLVECVDDAIVLKPTVISYGDNIQNADLSLVNIVSNYYRHEMYYPSAKFLLNNDLIALTLKKIKTQENVAVILATKPDINKQVVTTLGNADIQKIEYTCNEENLYLINLLYD